MYTHPSVRSHTHTYTYINTYIGSYSYTYIHTYTSAYVHIIYNIYIYIQNDQPVEIIDEERSLSVGPSTTSVVINNLQPGLSYDFKVH